MEDAIDSMAAVRPDDGAVLCLGVLLDDVAELADEHARLDGGNRFFKALPRALHHANCVWVGLGFVPHVVCLVKVAVEALVVQGNVNVDDVAVHESALVGNAMADDLVDRGADGLGEVIVV